MEVGEREGRSGGSEVRNGLQNDADNAVSNYYRCVSGMVWIHSAMIPRSLAFVILWLKVCSSRDLMQWVLGNILGTGLPI